MHKTILLLVSIFNCSTSAAQKQSDNFSGKWKTGDGIIIEVTKSVTSFNGKLVGKDVFILKNLTFTAGKWMGVLSNPKKGVNANCEAYLEPNKINWSSYEG
ncbi:MAG: hypothetical protein RL108_1205 [Bacteroidota bacterium]|jgi:hypothetical protein